MRTPGFFAAAPIAALNGRQSVIGRVLGPWQPVLAMSPVADPGCVVLRSRGGKVEPLRGRELARPGDRFREIDLRRRLISMAPQSIAVLEGVDAAVTATLVVRTVDPVAWATAAADPDAEVYLAAQIALRDAVSQVALEQLLAREVDLAPVLTAARSAGRDVGLEIADVVLKDVRAPHQLERARTEELEAEIVARTEVERARAEVKATRARLAAAQMFERSPVLAAVRVLEAVPAGARVTFGEGVLGGLIGSRASSARSDGDDPSSSQD